MLPVYKTCEGLSRVSDVQVELKHINDFVPRFAHTCGSERWSHGFTVQCLFSDDIYELHLQSLYSVAKTPLRKFRYHSVGLYIVDFSA